MSSPRTSSSSLTLRIAATAFGTLCVGFGINGILRPAHALSLFEMQPPVSTADRRVVDALMTVYSVREIFMGVATYAAVYYGHRKALGWIALATGGVGFADGLVCKSIAGQGEWNHWSLALMVAGVGSLLLVGDGQ